MIEKTNKLTRKEVLYTNEHFKFHFLDALQFDSPDKNSSSIHPPFVHEWFPQQQPPRSLRDTVIHLTVDLYSLSIHIHAIKDQTEDSNAPQSSPTDSIHDFEPSSTLVGPNQMCTA